MHYLNEWHDYLRVGMLLLSVWCCYTLICRYRQYGDDWTTKTKDYWYSLLMWSFVGIALPIQGVVLDRPLTPVTIVTLAAVLSTSKGLIHRGAWGGTDER